MNAEELTYKGKINQLDTLAYKGKITSLLVAKIMYSLILSAKKLIEVTISARKV